MWSAYFPLALGAAPRDGEWARRVSAFSAGIGVAGVAVHFKAWPWSLHGGLPMLDEAEGLNEDQLPAYNAVLWLWLLCSALNLPAANRPGARRFAIFGLLNFPSCSPPPSTTSRGRASRPSSSRSAGARRCANDRRWATALARRSPSTTSARRPSWRWERCRRTRRWADTAPRPRSCRRCSSSSTEREIAATFFVEGMNAELYPDLLREIEAGGHEVAYHAWRHEQWDELSARGQIENLARGIDAFERIGIEIAGLRPPGGRLGPGGVHVLHEAGLRYCSPAGAGAGVEDGVALLPFQWRHLDASCVLPPLAAAREQMTGSPDPVEPAAFVAFLETEIDRLAVDDGFLAIVLHPFMLDWLGEGHLRALLDRRLGRGRGGTSARALP